MSVPPRRRLSLPESGAISALLADVTGESAPAPRSDPAAQDFWGTVNWGNEPNDPGFAEDAPEPVAVARRLPDLAASTFLANVNWGNEPARASAVTLLLTAGDGPDPFAQAAYMSSFIWD